MLRSSSTAGQWMPYPPPAMRQFFRCAAVALSNRVNQASGTVVLLTKAGNKEETWLYSEEGSSWRITNLPGLEGCAQ